jgi:2-oxoglutarate ferredoxin oxidoreductase subunit delta
MVSILARQPLDLDRVVVPRGQVYTIPERCKGCNFCIEFCPEEVLVESSNLNAKGYHYPVVAEGKEDACVNCGFCRLICPEFSIYTEEIESQEVAP